MEQALEQARVGRLHILDCMERDTAQEFDGFKPRAELSRYAPRVKMIRIKPDRIRDVIGPGGKVIRAIQETTGTKIDIEDTGQVTIFSPDSDALERAEAMVQELTQEAELDRVYLGKVKRITDFGAFVEIFPGTDGLIHISHLAEGRVEKVTDVVSEGDEVLAKCIDIDPSGRIRLSRKEALAEAPRAKRACSEPGERVRRTRPPAAGAHRAPARRAGPAASRARDARGGGLRPARRRRGAPSCSRRAQRALVPTGFAIAVPEGYEAQVRPRSGLALAARHRPAQRSRYDRLRLPGRGEGDRVQHRGASRSRSSAATASRSS